ncbi:tetratricopeptide repeat protein [Pelagibius sp. CAU 1746]|uniref:tetratricopeptide repeat protein n=1 Tax=Pelagibius sp. CAU 1746 TaxID=3140370 RepID=UPI00325BD4DF
MADIFQEVDEDLRRDKAAEWWKRYSLFIYAAAVVVVLGVAGYKGWQAYDQKLRGERSNSYAEALALIDGGDEAKARQVLAALSDPAGDGYALLAALTEAQLAAESDDAAAGQIWQRLASEGTSGPAMSQLGSLLIVLERMDDGDPAVLRGELQSLAGPEAPYRFTALELLAVLALREGDREAAREHLVKITDDPAAPSGSRSRAAELLASLPG